jgi:uncharacterized protein
MTKDYKLEEGPVTVIISRRVKPGRVQEFEEWTSGISRQVSNFKGYYGMNIIPPSDPSNLEYVVIFRFNSYKNLKRWEDSSIRSEWLERVRDLTEGDSDVRKMTGLEYWFRVPNKPLTTPPPRYKMVIVTFIALFPTILLVSLVLNPLLGTLPELLRLAIAIIGTMILMTYWIMPLMTRLLALWLYDKSP